MFRVNETPAPLDILKSVQITYDTILAVELADHERAL